MSTNAPLLEGYPKDITTPDDAPLSNDTFLFSFFTNSSPWISDNIFDPLEESLMISTLEPTPFQDGAHMQAVPGAQCTFVPKSMAQSTLSQSSTFSQRQEDSWDKHFRELLQYKKKHGHCQIPQNYAEDLALARWCRRQRHQYKLKRMNKNTSMSDKRQGLLERAGFIWDPQTDVWEIRRQELEEYKRVHGHCNVPSRYAEKPQLAAWVKRQRRQYKQMQSGMLLRLPRERFETLDRMGFEWCALTHRH